MAAESVALTDKEVDEEKSRDTIGLVNQCEVTRKTENGRGGGSLKLVCFN